MRTFLLVRPRRGWERSRSAWSIIPLCGGACQGTLWFFPAGERFFSDKRGMLFPRRGKSVLALTGGGMPARMLAGSLQHRRGGTIPGPCRGRQSCRILESGLLHPPQAALRRFPPFSLFGCAKKQPGPPQNPQILWGEEGQRNGAESSPEAGTEWSGFRPDDGPCTVQKRKSA